MEKNGEWVAVEGAFGWRFAGWWRPNCPLDRIRPMPSDDQIIKTSFRLPRSVHAELEKAAAKAGLTVNGEAVYRLQHDPRANSAAAVLAEIQSRDTAVADGLRKQIVSLWVALDRANDTLAKVASAMSQVSPESSAAALKREVEFARELIGALSAHR